jgi:hypothetical protein
MKFFTLFLLIALPVIVYSQAKQLNKLLQQYAFHEFRWEKEPPVALQNSKELVAPDIISSDTLQVIKWKNIDSARIFDFSNGSVRIVLYGKVVKYFKCNATDTCSVKYFDSSYKATILADSIFIPLVLKTHGKGPVFSKKIRKNFRKALYHLNKTPVTECYSPVYNGQTVFYRSKTKEIIICNGCSDHQGSTHLTAKNLQHAKKVTLRILSPEMGPVIISFELYIVKAGKAIHISNQGADFNDELLKLTETIQPGDSFIFDQIVVQGRDGSKRTIQTPGFIVN